MAEISTIGVSLTYKADGATAATVVKIKDFPSILGKKNALEVTDLSDAAQRFIPGIRSQSESFDFTANYDAEVYGTINALTAEQNCELTFPDGSKFAWKGWVSASIKEGAVNAVLEMTVSITPTTVPTWTAST